MITNLTYLKRKFPVDRPVRHADGRSGRVRGYYRQPATGSLTVRVDLGSGRPTAIVPANLALA